MNYIISLLLFVSNFRLKGHPINPRNQWGCRGFTRHLIWQAARLLVVMTGNTGRSLSELQNLDSVWNADSVQAGENVFVEHFIGKVVGCSALLCRSVSLQ